MFVFFLFVCSDINDGPGNAPLSASDLGQLGGADQRVGLLQESPPGALVVVRAVMSLGVAVGGAEVVPASKRETFLPHQMVCMVDLSLDSYPLQTNESEWEI